ncbi:MAG: CAP domain-containing protein [Eubacteriales bacterium]|nr:CAP domain-containing protein [Eubacteriales bacterium]MDD4389820.1 CAP domain-containing protein [Eubacteriales bacterium]
MKKNLKRITAMLSALLITAMPAQAFAADTVCNLKGNLSQVKVKSSYSEIFSGKNCEDLLKNWGFKDAKVVKTATPVNNKVSVKNQCDTAGCDLSKQECNGNDCVTNNDCVANKDCVVSKDCAQNSSNCAKAGKINFKAANCNIGKNVNNNTDKDVNIGNDANTGKDVTNNTPPVNNNDKANETNTTPVVAASEAQQVTNIVNKERAAAGLASLTLDASLSKVAQAKAEDMAKNGYFSHTSPTYGSPFDMMKSFGVKYSAAGENIAKGQRSADSVMNAWMNSSGHRANILNGNYEKIGVGYTTDSQGNTYWVQMFIR